MIITVEDDLEYVFMKSLLRYKSNIA